MRRQGPAKRFSLDGLTMLLIGEPVGGEERWKLLNRHQPSAAFFIFFPTHQPHIFSLSRPHQIDGAWKGDMGGNYGELDSNKLVWLVKSSPDMLW